MLRKMFFASLFFIGFSFTNNVSSQSGPGITVDGCALFAVQGALNNGYQPGTPEWQVVVTVLYDLCNEDMYN